MGLGAEADSGAAVVEDGHILAAVNEERLSRLKLVVGFPRSSIREVLRLSGTEISELDAVLVAGRRELLVDELRPFDGLFEHWQSKRGLGGQVKRLAGTFSLYGQRFPFLKRAYYLALTPSFLRRRRAIRRILRDEFGVRCPIIFVDHHLCHVASAYFTSGFGDALVVSLDGGGDGRSGLIYAVRDGRFEYLYETSAYNSLGNYYAYVTHICGFKAHKHEGKITGLAAYGEPEYLPLLREFIDEENGTLVNKGGVVFTEAVGALEKRLPQGWKREDLSSSIQLHFEEVIRRLVGHWRDATDMSEVALAGGVFANVRVNEEVFGLPGVEKVFVHPGMGDGGLSVGAALAACVPGILEAPMPWQPEPLPDVYTGTDLGEAEISAALRRADLEPVELDTSLEETIADLLARGYVVARANGRMEYGPRALGNRSILYQPTDPSVNDWLNLNLRRTEFMPFAPAILAEARERCFENGQGAWHSAEFMTLTFHATPWMSRHMPGVVHLDGTARPQVVRRETNPSYYRIIEEFERRTGLPGIINTSFNMHEEPIVCTADDCVRAFLLGNLDYLALGSHLIAHPNGVARTLSPVARAERTGASPGPLRVAK
jgi:carbamoyltransferase